MAAGGSDDVGTTRLAADRATRTLTETLWSTLTVAVTGANGYFGHRLVKSLVAANVAQVVAVDRVHTRPWPRDRVRTVTADVRDPDAVRAALAGVDAVVHVASYYGNPPFSTVADSGEWAVNAEGTRNLLAASAAQGVRSFVYISSSSAIVSGREELLDVLETHPYPPRYLDFYGPAKAAAERFVLAAHGQPAERPLHTAVIRPSGIFGEDELLHIPRVLALVDRMGGYLPVYFAGDPRSDWTHTENLAWAVYLVLDQLRRPHGGRAGGEIFHITDGESLTYIAFFRPFVEACGGRVVPLVPLYLWVFLVVSTVAEYLCWALARTPGLARLRLQPPMTRLEAFKCCRTHTLSIAKAQRVLGYEPLISTGEGCARAAADFARKRRRATKT